MSDERTGVLAAAAWSAAIASRADPTRYRRGKEYVREQAVVSLVTEAGAIEGQVLGSRAEPYHVRITVPGEATARPGGVAVPAASALRFTCSCPDWEAPCKHAVAVALTFAERLRLAPGLLAALSPPGTTGVSIEPPGPAEVAPTPAGTRGHLRLVAAEERPAELDPAVEQFLQMAPDAPPLPPLPDAPAPISASFSVGRLELGAVVAEAVHWVAVGQRQYR